MPNTDTHGLVNINHLQVNENPELYQQQWMDRWLELVTLCPADNYIHIQEIQTLLQQLGVTEQASFSRLNETSKRPLRQMMRAANQECSVAALLKQLQSRIENIKPPKQTFWIRFKYSFKLLFSLRDSTFEMWLDEYPENEQAIQQIIKQLQQEHRRLTQENNTMAAEREPFNAVIKELEQVFDMLNALQSRWQQGDFSPDQASLIKDQFLPTLQHRIIEIQQQLLIARQTMMSFDLFVQQNKAQINGIKHAIEATVPVLKVTASLILLKNQRENIPDQNTLKPVKINEVRAMVENALNLIGHTSKKKSPESNKNDDSD